MFKMFIKKSAYLFVMILIAVAAGCDDSGVETPNDVTNPNVRAFDSLWVEEFMDTTSLCGLNLFYGSSVIRDSVSKDCQLIDTNGTGTGFYLRSGDLSDFNLPIGFKTRFNRIYTSISPANFDTIKVLPIGRDTILPELDFTEDDTRAWQYFEPNISGNQPVYSFYLQGKSINFHGVNIIGILQAIESSDSNPGNPGGYRMSFRVRINIAGENDFREIIPGQ
jgi:hypothetical protein